MDTRQRYAFLRAIQEQPEDDLPRLVYADWLDENGDPARAEFIRVQCEIAGWSVWCNGHCDPKLCRQCRSRRREQALLAEHAPRFLPHCVRPAHRTQWRTSDHVPGGVFIDLPSYSIESDYPFLDFVTFRRGFVEAVHGEWPGLDGTQFVAGCDRRFAATVRRLCHSQPVREVAWSFAGTDHTLHVELVPTVERLVEGEPRRFRSIARHAHTMADGRSREEMNAHPVWDTGAWTWREVCQADGPFEIRLRVQIANAAPLAAEQLAIDVAINEAEYVPEWSPPLRPPAPRPGPDQP